MKTAEHSAHITHAVETIAVLGAGTMGHGIAQVAAAAGFKVILNDVSPEQLARAEQSIARNLAKGIERGKVLPEERDQILSRIHFTVYFSEAAGEADLYIEAAPEILETKREILDRIEEAAEATRHDFIYATNTSSLSITEIAETSSRPERVVGMHFFNPVHLMQLVEIVVGRETGDDVVQTVRMIAERMKKQPITVKDVPGFASSRLGIALGLEAMRMVEQKVASGRDIDTAMELGYNHPVGPLRLTDIVGLDVRLHIAEYLHKTLESENFRPPEILRRMVGEGKLGKKSGEGFYVWEDK